MLSEACQAAHWFRGGSHQCRPLPASRKARLAVRSASGTDPAGFGPVRGMHTCCRKSRMQQCAKRAREGDAQPLPVNRGGLKGFPMSRQVAATACHDRLSAMARDRRRARSLRRAAIRLTRCVASLGVGYRPEQAAPTVTAPAGRAQYHPTRNNRSDSWPDAAGGGLGVVERRRVDDLGRDPGPGRASSTRPGKARTTAFGGLPLR